MIGATASLPAFLHSFAPIIDKTDVVFGDYPFYYIAKERAQSIYLGRYYHQMKPEDFDRLTLVVIGSHDSEWKQSERPLTNMVMVGQWKPARNDLLETTGIMEFYPLPNYACTVYRMKEPTNQCHSPEMIGAIISAFCSTA